MKRLKHNRFRPVAAPVEILGNRHQMDAGCIPANMYRVAADTITVSMPANVPTGPIGMISSRLSSATRRLASSAACMPSPANSPTTMIGPLMPSIASASDGDSSNNAIRVSQRTGAAASDRPAARRPHVRPDLSWTRERAKRSTFRRASWHENERPPPPHQRSRPPAPARALEVEECGSHARILTPCFLDQPRQRDACEIAVGQEQRINDDISRRQRPDRLVHGGRTLDETEADFRRNTLVSKSPLAVPPRHCQRPSAARRGRPAAARTDDGPPPMARSVEEADLVPHAIFAGRP